MDNEVPMTLKGKEKLVKDLDQLIKVEREGLKKAIAEARELGDLKENSEYHAAKEKQALVEGRIMELQSKLARANVVDVSKLDSSKIVFGATVKLFDTEKEVSLTYQIVGDDEANLKEGKVSFSSPIGQALIGKEEGDTIIVRAPKGDIEYEVEAFEFK